MKDAHCLYSHAASSHWAHVLILEYKGFLVQFCPQSHTEREAILLTLLCLSLAVQGLGLPYLAYGDCEIENVPSASEQKYKFFLGGLF